MAAEMHFLNDNDPKHVNIFKNCTLQLLSLSYQTIFYLIIMYIIYIFRYIKRVQFKGSLILILMILIHKHSHNIGSLNQNIKKGH